MDQYAIIEETAPEETNINSDQQADAPAEAPAEAEAPTEAAAPAAAEAPSEAEAPTVFFNIAASASEGGSVDTTGGSIASETLLTITAIPETEYIFIVLTGTSSLENPLTITVNSNLTITANFEKRKYPLTINKEGEGTIKEEIVSTG